MTGLTAAERRAAHLANAPLDVSTIALECTLCDHVRVVEEGTEVACRHGGEWVPMRAALSQVAARARAITQGAAWEAETAEQLVLREGER